MTLQFGTVVDTNFTDKRRAAGYTNATVLGTPANYVSEATLDARLTAIDSTSYSAERLRIMTTNDKVFAVRSADDSAGI